MAAVEEEVFLSVPEKLPEIVVLMMGVVCLLKRGAALDLATEEMCQFFRELQEQVSVLLVLLVELWFLGAQMHLTYPAADEAEMFQLVPEIQVLPVLEGLLVVSFFQQELLEPALGH